MLFKNSHSQNVRSKLSALSSLATTTLLPSNAEFPIVALRKSAVEREVNANAAAPISLTFWLKSILVSLLQFLKHLLPICSTAGVSTVTSDAVFKSAVIKGRYTIA